MAEILVFPTKKELPQEIEDCIQEIGKAYIQILNYALTELAGDDPSDAELDEIKGMVELSYAKALFKAIDEIEEKL